MAILIIRSLILYLLLIIVIRLLGKRQLGEMEPSEFVVTLLIADLASVPMQDLGIPLMSGIVPILSVLVLEIILSFLSYYSITFRKILCGRPVVLMENGKIIQDNLKKTRITPDELTELLREKEIIDLSIVKYAILETNGQVSAILDTLDQPLTARTAGKTVSPLFLPITLISGGKILSHNLMISGHDQKWIDSLLQKHGCKTKDVFLLTVDGTDQIYLSIKERHL